MHDDDRFLRAMDDQELFARTCGFKRVNRSFLWTIGFCGLFWGIVGGLIYLVVR